MPTKLIEVALPLDAINKQAAREKSIRHGHPSTLHLWWARRPLAACRAVLFAQLVDDPSSHPTEFPTPEAQDAERRRLFSILERLSRWEATTDESLLESARAEIRRSCGDATLSVLDPFSGGGSIPLEAQRLGLQAYASDLNPVAVLITKALIELPPKFAGRPPVHPEAGTLEGSKTWTRAQGLADDVRWYGRWMAEEAGRRLAHLYPAVRTPDGALSPAIAWVWARTVECPNPACRATMPLARSFWLGKKKGKEAWIKPVVKPNEKFVSFEISHDPSGPETEGTKVGRGASFFCLTCGQPTDTAYIKNQGLAGHMGFQLMATVVEGHRQRVYVAPNPEQQEAADTSVPDDELDAPLADDPRNVWCVGYGLVRHSDLYTRRQLRALSTFSDLVLEARQLVYEASDGDGEYSDAIATYLAFLVGKTADRNSAVCSWDSSPSKETPRSTFARQALPMAWDIAEGNPFATGSGNWLDAVEFEAQAIERLPAQGFGQSTQADATNREYNGYVICTDPPYYDNISYSDLADFFYVWFRRSLRDLYPELLGTMLTPKSSELVASPYRHGGSKEAAEQHFEQGFSQVFSRAAAESLPGIPITIFYAFKQSETVPSEGNLGPSAAISTGWEKMLTGLLGSGLSITGTWPMRTELGNRLISAGTNALASSIVLVCRPRGVGAQVTDRRGFAQALKDRLSRDLRVLQSGGIAPVDLAQAAIGPGMAVFSSYARVIEPDGSAMTVRRALQLINQVLDEVAAEQEGEFDEDTRWSVAWYSEFGFDEGPYGRADDLSRAKNVSVDGLFRAGIVERGGGKVRLLDRSELDPNWDPASDSRLTVWEVTQHLVRRLTDEGDASAADLLARVGGLGEAARDLAYRLFQIAESKRWAKEAGPYNALAAAWPELTRLASAGPMGQGSLNV